MEEEERGGEGELGDGREKERRERGERGEKEREVMMMGN